MSKRPRNTLAREHNEDIRDDLFESYCHMSIDPIDVLSQYLQRHLATMEVIGLFTYLLYGSSIPYDSTEVEDLASSHTYPPAHLKSNFTKQLLGIIQESKCQPSRVIIVDYDRLLCNAMTRIIEACQLPIDGIYFHADTYSPMTCCRQINELSPKYVLFRSQNVVACDPPRKK